ncbi:MAG: aldehyde dehydrogenase family protein [Bacteroidetes bacterium]|nr:aldehyde dehydrogenase family protein [Bacteroidota bacterium]
MLRSIDPYRQTLVAKYDNDTSEDLQKKIKLSEKTGMKWSKWTIDERVHGVLKLIDIIQNNKEVWAEMMAREMGKPLSQGIAEVEKCISLCQHYSEKANEYLSPQQLWTTSEKVTILRKPYGIWLGIMPWNFPMWQVFRFAIPALLAGNTVLLKHSQHVTGCALLIEESIQKAWMNDGLFQVLRIASHQVDEVLSHPAVSGVSLTGSESAGRSVAALAGRNIKISILELGGSNAMIVDEHADLRLVIDGIVWGRFNNSGQSCIAAKRILVHESRWNEIQIALAERIKQFKIGDPLDRETFIGPLVNIDAAEHLEKQYKLGIDQGAEVIVPMMRSQALCTPGVVAVHDPKNILWQEETFGPLAVLMPWNDMKQCLSLRQHEHYALGTSIYTPNTEVWMKKSDLIHEPTIVFNNIVKSSPHLPFGGLKKSGFGTELGEAGIQSFTYPQVIQF